MLASLFLTAVEATGSLLCRAVQIRTGRLRCPDCSAPLPFFHPPRSWRQSVSGGRDCPACGVFFQSVGGRPVSLADAEDVE